MTAFHLSLSFSLSVFTSFSLGSLRSLSLFSTFPLSASFSLPTFPKNKAQWHFCLSPSRIFSACKLFHFEFSTFLFHRFAIILLLSRWKFASPFICGFCFVCLSISIPFYDFAANCISIATLASNQHYYSNKVGC